ncbi:unnamed protein product [Owenia fusiformis]|uniref:SRCR domain-containing protein n=1 Tax=Owenia fusiformis TaxID=6347 RepID=A0A8S4PPN0_OWEFU|nr:unnamed protein product [Owenia fusiformis]
MSVTAESTNSICNCNTIMFRLEVILILLSFIEDYSLEGKKDNIFPFRKTQVRLVGGDNDEQGRLEVKVNGTWGTVAPLRVIERGPTELQISQEICKKLGFPPNAARYVRDKFGPGEGLIYTMQTKVSQKKPKQPFKFWLEECHGKKNGQFCTHNDDIGFECDRWKLLYSDVKFDGYLNTYRNQGWKPITFYPSYSSGNLETNLFYYINHRVACNTFGADTSDTRTLGKDSYAIKHVPSDFSQNWPEYICSNEVKIKENKHCSINISTETKFNIEKFKTTVQLECERKQQRKIFQKELKQCVSIKMLRAYMNKINRVVYFDCPLNYQVKKITLRHGNDSVIFGYPDVCTMHSNKWCLDDKKMKFYFNKIKNYCKGLRRCQPMGEFIHNFYVSCNATEQLARIFTYNCEPISSEFWTQTVDYYGFREFGKMHTYFEVNDNMLYKHETWGITRLLGDSIEEVTKKIACDEFEFKKSPQRHEEESEDYHFMDPLMDRWKEHYHLGCGPKDKHLDDCRISTHKQGHGTEFERNLRCIDESPQNHRYGSCAVFDSYDKNGKTTCDFHRMDPNPPSELCCNCWLLFQDPFTLEAHPWGAMSKAAKSACSFKGHEKICPCVPELWKRIYISYNYY